MRRRPTQDSGALERCRHPDLSKPAEYASQHERRDSSLAGTVLGRFCLRADLRSTETGGRGCGQGAADARNKQWNQG